MLCATSGWNCCASREALPITSSWIGRLSIEYSPAHLYHLLKSSPDFLQRDLNLRFLLISNIELTTQPALS